jgi:hypothetical protein
MSFISDTDKSKFKDGYKTFFDTFKKNITIHKRGKVNVVDVNLDQLFGYDEPANETNYTYDVDFQTFYGLIVYPQRGKQTSDHQLLTEIRATILDDQVLIKVEESCKIYLTTGTIERIDVKDKFYKLISEESQVNNIIDGYFLFRLEETK